MPRGIKSTAAPPLNVTDAEEKRAAERRAAWPLVFAARMAPALASTMTGRAEVEVPLPSLEGLRGAFPSMTAPGAAKGAEAARGAARGFVVGDRLFYREYFGAYSGRADLLTIVRFVQFEEDAAKAGNYAIVYRSFGWSRGKVDDDLSELSLRVVNPESDGVQPLVGPFTEPDR